MQTYFMGIDNGGTFSKAVIFDSNGVQIAGSARQTPILTPYPGFTERDMEQLWIDNCACIREALENSSINSENIVGVACTGHGKGLYLWGKNDRPAYNGIVSTDGRAWEYPLKWKKDGTFERIYKKTCQQVLASQPVCLLNWLQDHKPHVLDNVQWIFSVKDYIRYRLTGVAYGEMTDFSGTNLVNIITADYDKELLREFGLERLYGCLPPLRYSNDLCGVISKETAALTGLKEGTPVAGGMFDIDACAVAMDVTNEEDLCVIAGTWSINEYISKKPVDNKTVLMNSIFCLPGYYLIEECSPTSAGNNEWFTKMFLRELEQEAKKRCVKPYELANEMAMSVQPADANIIFLPYIYGSNYNTQAKASLVGMDSSHNKAQIVRTVYEGIAFCHMVHIEKLLQNRPLPRTVRLAGGAANSDVWVQIFADVFGLPIEIVDVNELGALGCAMSAAVAVGVYPDLKTAAEHMVKIKKRVEPILENVEYYKKKIGLYKKVSACLEPVWGDLKG